MVTKSTPNLFSMEMVSIRRGPNESQEQFDATKDQATFPFKGETHTLVFDGKTDDVVLKQFDNPETRFITDLQQLRGKSTSILKACKASEDDFYKEEDIRVELGTDSDWVALYDQNPEDPSYTLLPQGVGRAHSIAVKKSEQGLLMTVQTETQAMLTSQPVLKHVMTGLLTADGQVIPNSESVIYRDGR